MSDESVTIVARRFSPVAVICGKKARSTHACERKLVHIELCSSSAVASATVTPCTMAALLTSTRTLPRCRTRAAAAFTASTSETSTTAVWTRFDAKPPPTRRRHNDSRHAARTSHSMSLAPARAKDSASSEPARTAANGVAAIGGGKWNNEGAYSKTCGVTAFADCSAGMWERQSAARKAYGPQWPYTLHVSAEVQ
eukprot:1690868-Pleurochrysis_carterae.AAC.6